MVQYRFAYAFNTRSNCVCLGPISAVHSFGQAIVLLNTYQACDTLLNKRPNIYSQRPYMHFAGM
jgi:hypothetical protein